MNVSENILTVLNNVVDQFPDNTVENITELVNAGEPGVALEVFITQLLEYEINLSPYDKLLLMETAKKMKLDFNLC